MQTLVRRRVDAKDAAADVPAVALLAVLLQASLMNWRVGGTKAHADEWLRAIYVHNMLQGDGFMVGLLFMLTCLLLWAGRCLLPGIDQFSGCHRSKKNFHANDDDDEGRTTKNKPNDHTLVSTS